jgi:hypothetical protein
MMSVSRSVGSILLSSFTLVVACGGGQSQVAPTVGQATTTAARMADSATASIATARCDREELCDNVGVGKKYATRDACVMALRERGRNDLKATDCPSGVDMPALDKCLSEIRGERCGNALDSVTRLVTCRTAALCSK